ncbi:hypothetical protein KS4_01150 [Poriferisphaera corsica]|uniref:Uncharacterized protein n=1 Tax=Poriferisphaera corsica TaxID=2528020 RepID=A0A517YPE4_9BACT|nr:hypothetical protein KS4_01150 [Poriferisphaera corsica]
MSYLRCEILGSQCVERDKDFLGGGDWGCVRYDCDNEAYLDAVKRYDLMRG